MMARRCAKLFAARDEEAISWFRRSIGADPNLPMPHFLMASALARLDRLEQAHDALHVGLELNPSFTVARFLSAGYSDHPAYVAGRKLTADGMRKAGAPEE